MKWGICNGSVYRDTRVREEETMPKRSSASFPTRRTLRTLRITIAILTPLMLMGALESNAAAQSIKCSVAPALALFDGNGDGILTTDEIRSAAPDNAELQGQASQLEAKGISGIQYVGCDPSGTETGSGTGTTPGTGTDAGAGSGSGTGTTPGTGSDAGSGGDSGSGSGTGSGTGTGTGTGTESGDGTGTQSGNGDGTGTGTGTQSGSGSSTSSSSGSSAGNGSATTGGSTSGSTSVAGKTSTTTSRTGSVIGSLPNTGSGDGFTSSHGTPALMLLLCAASALSLAGAFASRRSHQTW